MASPFRTNTSYQRDGGNEESMLIRLFPNVNVRASGPMPTTLQFPSSLRLHGGFSPMTRRARPHLEKVRWPDGFACQSL